MTCPCRSADHGQGGGDINAVDAREVYAAHLEQLRAQIELWSITCTPTLLALGRYAVISLQALQLLLDLLVALAELCANKVERAERLFERKQMLGTPVALQTLGDLVNAGVDTHVLHRAQHLAITFTRHNRTQNLLTRLAHHVSDDVGQLDVHLRERLLLVAALVLMLHVLHVSGLTPEQHATLAPQRAQHTHLLSGAKRTTEQAIGHELLQPLAVQYVRLAPGDVFDVARVDQQYREAARSPSHLDAAALIQSP